MTAAEKEIKKIGEIEVFSPCEDVDFEAFKKFRAENPGMPKTVPGAYKKYVNPKLNEITCTGLGFNEKGNADYANQVALLVKEQRIGDCDQLCHLLASYFFENESVFPFKIVLRVQEGRKTEKNDAGIRRERSRTHVVLGVCPVEEQPLPTITRQLL